jgi:hypothetical protein
LTKEPKTYVGEKIASFNKWFWENQLSTYMQKMKLDSYLLPCKSQFKMDNFENAAGKTLENISIGKHFINRTQSPKK